MKHKIKTKEKGSDDLHSVLNDPGFTFIEIIVVVAIVILLAVVGARTASHFGKNQAVQVSTEALGSALNEARVRTLASENASQYGVYAAVGSSSVVLFRGASYIPSDPDNKVFAFDPRVEISTTTLGATTSIVFTRLSGTTTPATVTIEYTDASATSSVSVQATGLISSS